MGRWGKVVLGVAAVAALGAAGLVAVIAMQPSQAHVERSVVMAATPADVFPFAHDLDLWMRWNPWDSYEPTSKKAFSEPRSGVGAWYTWDGEQVGSGKMTIAAAVPGESVAYDLHFTSPFEARASVGFTFTPVDGGTRVVWTYDAEQGFVSKGFGLLVDMDAMLGADFEKGLAALKPLAEQAAAERVAREAALAAVPVDPAAAPATAAP